MREVAAVSERLAALDDARLLKLLGEGSAPAAGIGGSTTTIAVDGLPVFVKRVPLTDLELAHSGSTANLFNRPVRRTRWSTASRGGVPSSCRRRVSRISTRISVTC